jgi:L-fuconolactonase
LCAEPVGVGIVSCRNTFENVTESKQRSKFARNRAGFFHSGTVLNMDISNLPVIEQPFVRPNWLKAYCEDALEPDLAIIDPHHHLSDVKWGGYLPSDLAADLGSGHNIVATVHVQCGFGYRSEGPALLRPVGETERIVAISGLANQQQSHTNISAGIVGYADLSRGFAVDELLIAHVEAGRGHFRGIRCVAASHEAFQFGTITPPPLHLYSSTDFRQGYSRLESFGLSFDSWAYHTQLDELYDLAKSFPNTDVIVNHIGGPLGIGPYADHRKEATDEWKISMGKLASLPNVYVKLGGLGMAVLGFDFHTKTTPPTSTELAKAWGPLINICIDLFGVSRCMFESNFPVDKGTCSYQILWNTFKRISAGMSFSERTQLFHDTAARIYHL